MNWKKSKDAAAKADPGAEKAAPGAGGPAAFVKKNWKWLVPVVCVVALGGWFILRPSPAQNTNVDINYVQTTPEKRDVTNTLSGTGILNPANTYNVKSLVAGKVLTSTAEEGEIVEEGDVLYTVDSSDATTKAEQASIALQQAQRSYDKTVDRQYVRAEVAGVVSTLKVAKGDEVTSGQEVAVIRDSSKMTLQLEFPAADAASFSVGQSAEVTLDGTFETITGIDYRHPAFLRSNGQSRILSIWDQTDRTGTPPPQFPYGSLYEKSDLDDALRSRDPLSVVPVTDPDGHGTYVAGVAGGTPNASAGFLGAAPEADFAVVKLKPAKQNLKDFYLVSTNAPVFEEDDLLSAMRFLNEVAAREGKPLVICLALGTNQGSHSGTLPIALTLARYGNTPGIIPVCATGNEGNAAHHYYGSVSENDSPKNVEFLVSEGSRGFVLEFWGQVPQLFSVGFRSPGGETIPRIPVSLTQEQRITFVLERTVIYVNYEVVQTTTGSQLILIRMLDPTPGIWTLQVYRAFPSPPDFHVWLPITGFSTSDVIFLEPDPYTTLTTPSATVPVLSPSTYQASNNSFSPESGRGFTRLGEIKPDFASPGISVTGPGPAGSYENRSGASASAAITSGAAALFLQWGIQRTPSRYFTAQELKNYLIRGAGRTDTITYPSREWGYGRLQLYQSFLSLMTN